jgi:hypothetical protein
MLAGRSENFFAAPPKDRVRLRLEGQIGTDPGAPKKNLPRVEKQAGSSSSKKVEKRREFHPFLSLFPFFDLLQQGGVELFRIEGFGQMGVHAPG